MRNKFFELIDLSIEDIPLSKTDVQSIKIYQSIHDIGLITEVYFNDITDIATNLPIKGGESIKFQFRDVYGKEVFLDCVSISFNPLIKIGQKDSYSYLKFIEKKAFTLMTKRSNKFYENVLISKIVSELSSDIEVLTTNENISVLNPGWSLNKFIQYLKQVSENKKYEGNYKFFETFDSINFFPLAKIIDVESVQTYVINDRNPNYRYNIIKLDETQNFNYLETEFWNIKNNRFVQYNPDSKEIIKTDRTFSDYNQKSSSLGQGIILRETERSDQKLNAVSFFNGQINSQYDIDAIDGEYQKRIEVLLNGDLSLQAGSLINIALLDRYKQTEFNKENAGVWLVEKLSYNITQDDFKIYARLVKNASYEGTRNSGKIISPDILI